MRHNLLLVMLVAVLSGACATAHMNYGPDSLPVPTTLIEEAIKQEATETTTLVAPAAPLPQPPVAPAEPLAADAPVVTITVTHEEPVEINDVIVDWPEGMEPAPAPEASVEPIPTTPRPPVAEVQATTEPTMPAEAPSRLTKEQMQGQINNPLVQMSSQQDALRSSNRKVEQYASELTTERQRRELAESKLARTEALLAKEQAKVADLEVGVRQQKGVASAMDSRIANVNQEVSRVNERLGRIEKTLDRIPREVPWYANDAAMVWMAIAVFLLLALVTFVVLYIRGRRHGSENEKLKEKLKDQKDLNVRLDAELNAKDQTLQELDERARLDAEFEREMQGRILLRFRELNAKVVMGERHIDELKRQLAELGVTPNPPPDDGSPAGVTTVLPVEPPLSATFIAQRDALKGLSPDEQARQYWLPRPEFTPAQLARWEQLKVLLQNTQ